MHIYLFLPQAHLKKIYDAAHKINGTIGLINKKDSLMSLLRELFDGGPNMKTKICFLLFPYKIGGQRVCNIADKAEVTGQQDPNGDFFFKFLQYLFGLELDGFLRIRLLLIHLFAQSTPYSVNFISAVTREILNAASITDGSSNGINAEALAESIMIELGDGPLDLQASAVENAALIMGFPEVDIAAASTFFMTEHSRKYLLLRLYQFFFKGSYLPLKRMTLEDLKEKLPLQKECQAGGWKEVFFFKLVMLVCTCSEPISNLARLLALWMGVLRIRDNQKLNSLRKTAMDYLDQYGILDATGRNNEGPHKLNLLYIGWSKHKSKLNI